MEYNCEYFHSLFPGFSAPLFQKNKDLSGIAQEIQNPLNFVNNFSEVSNEMVDEVKTELAIRNHQQAIEIADEVKQILKKFFTTASGQTL